MTEQSMVIERLTRELAEARETNRNNVAGHEQQIADLKCELIEARAACVAMRQFIEYYADDRIPPDQLTRCPETVLGGLRFNAGVILANPSPGQPLLADYDRLRRLEAAVGDDSLMRLFYKDSGHADVTMLILRSYRAALLAAMKGETK